MPSPSNYNQSKAEKVLELRKQGLSFKEMGIKLGISKGLAYTWFKRAKKEQKTPKKSNGKGSKAPIIREWVRSNPNGTHKDFHRDTKIKVNGNYFSTLRCQTIREMGVAPTHHSAKKPKIEKSSTHLKDLKKENEFLHWWLQGERQGFVDLLLKQINS